VEATGYLGAIVFNRTGVNGCETLVSMQVAAGIPAVFVSRTDGFRILGGLPAEYSCNASGAGTAAPSVGTDGQTVDIKVVFAGWGYVHLYDANTMEEVDQYYLPEGQDPAFAAGFGDLSVHEVATDPDEDLAYISRGGPGVVPAPALPPAARPSPKANANSDHGVTVSMKRPKGITAGSRCMLDTNLVMGLALGCW